MNSCNLRIINSHACLIPIGKEIREVYKLFSSSDCDILVGIPSEISGCVGSRGYTPKGDGNYSEKITYEERLWRSSDIEIQIKWRNSVSPPKIEQLGNITGFPSSVGSINFIFEEDPVNKLMEIPVEYGIYPNNLALKILRNCPPLSVEELCRDANDVLINELTIERRLDTSENLLQKVTKREMTNVKPLFVTIKFRVSHVFNNLEKLRRIKDLF